MYNGSYEKTIIVTDMLADKTDKFNEKHTISDKYFKLLYTMNEVDSRTSETRQKFNTVSVSHCVQCLYLIVDKYNNIQ